MNETLLGNASLPAFLLASLVLAATPGPGVVYIVTRTLAQGRLAGLSSVAGVALGNLANAIGASIGLAALFSISSLAFTAVKYAGAAYLIYLGVKTLGCAAAPARAAFGAANLAPIVRDGFFVALLNPKTALFFAAFLPQFLDPARSALLQSVLLGSLFVLVAIATDCLYVLTAIALQPTRTGCGGLRGPGRYLSASVLIGLGIVATMNEARTPK